MHIMLPVVKRIAFYFKSANATWLKKKIQFIDGILKELLGEKNVIRVPQTFVKKCVQNADFAPQQIFKARKQTSNIIPSSLRLSFNFFPIHLNLLYIALLLPIALYH